MKTRTALTLALGLLTVGGVATAQSPSADPSPTTTTLCVDVLGAEPIEGWNATSLRLAIEDDRATITDAGPCPTPTDPAPTPTESAYTDDATVVAAIDNGFDRVQSFATKLQTQSGNAVWRTLVAWRNFAKAQVSLDYQPSPCLETAWSEYQQSMHIQQVRLNQLFRWVQRTGGYGKPPDSSAAFEQAGRLLRMAHQEADNASCAASNLAG